MATLFSIIEPLPLGMALLMLCMPVLMELLVRCVWEWGYWCAEASPEWVSIWNMAAGGSQATSSPVLITLRWPSERQIHFRYQLTSSLLDWGTPGRHTLL